MGGISRTTFLMGTMTLFIAAVAGYLMLVRPAYDDVQNSRGELRALEMDIDKKSKIFEEAEKLLKQYDNLTDLRADIALVLPFENDTAHAMAQLVLLMKRNNITQESIGSQDPEAVPAAHNSNSAYGYAFLPIDIEGGGRYEDIKNFVREVESNTRLMDFDTFQITPIRKQGSEQGIFSFSATVNVYYQLENSVAPRRGGASRR